MTVLVVVMLVVGSGLLLAAAGYALVAAALWVREEYEAVLHPAVPLSDPPPSVTHVHGVAGALSLCRDPNCAGLRPTRRNLHPAMILADNYHRETR